MSHYKPYPTYKDSGVDWLGRVPEHWQVRPLGYEIELLTGYAFPSERFDFQDGTPLVRGDNVTEGVLRWGDKARFWPQMTPELGRFLLEDRDVLIGMDGSKVGKNYAMVKAADLPLLLVQRVARLRSLGRVTPDFIYRLIGSPLFRAWVDLVRTDPAIPHISPKDISSFPIPIPPFAEQEVVLSCLDRETARIDALIEKKTRFIELLREKRQALITHAVTKGLDPNVKMKDSGVEWLGEVPEHWVCKKLMYWMDGYGSGTTPSKDDDYCIKGGLPWVTTGELREGLVCETDKRVTDAALSEYSALKAHPAGSLVIAMYGATVGRLGLLGVPAALNQACFAIHPCKTISIRMLRWWFEGFRAELIELATGAGQPNISGDKIRNLFIAAPLSLAEQEQIADQIESRTLRIDGLVSKTERSIELLKERRSALITAAVTGQIDLREAV
ncbi:TPA: restriction endonuclease subunit S [Pseudomonas aeruginosa]|nr:restriction endonuclease subunit S [Pseudomonas aeruginosa]